MESWERRDNATSYENARARGGDWTSPTMLNLLLCHWLISSVDLRASSSFYFTAWLSRLRLTLGFKQLILGSITTVSPASETETQFNAARCFYPWVLNLISSPWVSKGENGVSLARILGLNHVNRRPCWLTKDYKLCEQLLHHRGRKKLLFSERRCFICFFQTTRPPQSQLKTSNTVIIIP